MSTAPILGQAPRVRWMSAPVDPAAESTPPLRGAALAGRLLASIVITPIGLAGLMLNTADLRLARAAGTKPGWWPGGWSRSGSCGGVADPGNEIGEGSSR